MSNNVINPDSAMMQQAEGQWQKFAALMTAKYLKDTGKASLYITLDDMKEFELTEANVLLTHGHHDSIEFKMVTHSEAMRLAQYDAQRGGRA